MNVLFVTNMYPVKSMQYYGIYVKEQIDYLTEHFDINSYLYFINSYEFGKFEYVKSIYKIRSIVKQRKIDVIHIHYGLSGLFLLFYRPKVNIFLTFHGGDIQHDQGRLIQNLLSKLIARKVKRVFVLNQEMVKEVQKLNIDYELLPCGINTDFFKNSAIKDISSTTKLVLFPGDPARDVKNYPLFQDVLKIARKMTPYEIRSECIHDMSRIEVRNALSTANCLLMTSTSEGSPQIVKEALSCGLPVVSVNVGDVEKMLENIPSCYISITRDPLELAKMILKAIDGDVSNIRDAFVRKGLYDNRTICKRLIENYTFDDL